MLSSLGFHTEQLKTTIVDEQSQFDLLFQSFDRDMDGVICSQDYAETLRGLDSEVVLRMRARKGHTHRQLKSATSLFKDFKITRHTDF